MDRFQYRAIDAHGELTDGELEAASLAHVFAELDRAGLVPLSAQKAVAGKRPWRERLQPEPGGEHITAFTLDLAMLLKGGVTLGEGLSILAGLEGKPWARRLIRSLHADISSGKSFSEALGRHPTLFPPVYAKTVEVAEAAGRLEDALAGLARERARGEAMRKRVVGAVSYPLFLVVAALGVLAFVLLYIIPQFETAIAAFRDRMDPSALFVFDLSRLFRDNLDIVGGAVVLLLLAVVVGQRIARERNLAVLIASRLPLTRTIVAFDETVTFCRTLAILTDNGVDISAALRLLRGVARLPSTAEKLDAVTAEVRQGRRLSDALAGADVLPAHVVSMLRIGEESGHLGDSAARVALFYEGKLDATLGRLTAVLGPALMIGVAVLIAWVIISVMTALISINDLLA